MSQIGTLKIVDGNGDEREIPVFEEDDVQYPALKVKTEDGVGAIRMTDQTSSDVTGLRIHTDASGTCCTFSGVASHAGEMIVLDNQTTYRLKWISPSDGTIQAQIQSVGDDQMDIEAGNVIDYGLTLTRLYEDSDENFHMDCRWATGDCQWNLMWQYDFNTDWNLRGSAGHTRGVGYAIVSGTDASGTRKVWKVYPTDQDTNSVNLDEIISGFMSHGGTDVESTGDYWYGWGIAGDGNDYLRKYDEYGNQQWSVQLQDARVESYESTDYYVPRRYLELDPNDDVLALARNYDSNGEIDDLEVRSSSDGSLLDTLTEPSREIRSVRFGPNPNGSYPYLYCCSDDYLRQYKTTDGSNWSLNQSRYYTDDSVASNGYMHDVGIGVGGQYIYTHAGTDSNDDNCLRQIRVDDFSEGWLTCNSDFDRNPYFAMIH